MLLFLQKLSRILLTPFFCLGEILSYGIDYVFKYNTNLYFSYQEGIFYFYWCVSWLVVRLTMRSYFVTLLFQEESVIHSTIQVILITLFSMCVAFAIAVVIGLFGSITLFVRRIHMDLLFNNKSWITLVVTLSGFHRYICHTRARIVCFLLFAIYLFLLNFFSTGLFSYYCLGLWLPFLYAFVYFNRVVFAIFPVMETTNEIFKGIDGDFYIESLYVYYGKPFGGKKGFYSQSSRKKNSNS